MVKSKLFVSALFLKLSVGKHRTCYNKATGGVWGQKNMLMLFERFHRCGVNAFYGMSKFCSLQKLSAFQCVGSLTFL